MLGCEMASPPPIARPAPRGANVAGIARDRAALLAVMFAAVVVFIGALSYFFGQDDFAGLARARGLLAPLHGPWRFVSGQLYFWLMRPLGLAAAGYHAVNVFAHAACAGLLFAMLRRRFAAPAALLGALCFAAHPALYMAVYSVSGVGEILALLFALAAMWAATRPGRAAWIALPLFALSLLSKESTVLLPIALWIVPGWIDPVGAPASPPGAARSPGGRALRVALLVLALADLASWFGGDAFGTRAGLDPSAPYAVSLGPHVAINAATYLGWTANMLLPTTRTFEDLADPALAPWAVALAAAWLAGFALRPLRRRGWFSGGATFALLIAPVLGLRNHTYHYYLYAPLIGAAWCVAALGDAAFRRPAAPSARASRTPAREAPGPGPDSSERAIAWPATLALGALLVLNGALLVRKIETMPFVDPRLRADPIVDRARIARRVYEGLRRAELPPRAELVFWSPASMRYERLNHPDSDPIHVETYWERNVRSALLDGLAVRVMFPAVDSVVFIHAYRPAGDRARFVLYDPDGTVTVESPAHLDSVMRAAAGHP